MKIGDQFNSGWLADNKIRGTNYENTNKPKEFFEELNNCGRVAYRGYSAQRSEHEDVWRDRQRA
jgi:hypothetical protein